MTDDTTTPPPSAPVGAPNDPDIMMVKIPLLVSGIVNALSAVSLILVGIPMILAIVGCFILPFGVAAGVLAFFEIKAFMDINENGYNPEKRSKIQLLSILEMCTIIFGNVPSLVCGILIMVTLPKLDQRAV